MALKLIAFDVGHTLVDERIDATNFVEPIQLMPHVREVLPQIRMPMATWSNTQSARGRDVRCLLRAAGIEKFFTWVITSIDAGHRKPKSEFFEFALRNCGISADEALFVGNQLNTDVCGGLQCGIKTVWISGEAHHSPDETMVRAEICPDYEISSLTELPELVTRIRNQKP